MIRRYRRSPRRWLVLLAMMAVAVLARLFSGPASDLADPAPESLAEGVYAIERVVDGDTLRLESGERLRLQGIDTPETVKEDTPVEAWGLEASAYTTRFIKEANGRLRLTFGPERVDRYGRLLAFAWHEERLLNEELVREGLARARLGYNYSESLKRRLQRAEAEAREAGRGIWSGEPPGTARTDAGL